MEIQQYKFKVKHDNGTIIITTSASNLFAARLNVMKAEKCPESSLKLIEHGTDID